MTDFFGHVGAANKPNKITDPTKLLLTVQFLVHQHFINYLLADFVCLPFTVGFGRQCMVVYS